MNGRSHEKKGAADPKPAKNKGIRYFILLIIAPASQTAKDSSQIKETGWRQWRPGQTVIIIFMNQIKGHVNSLWISASQTGISAREKLPPERTQSIHSHAFTNCTQARQALIKKVMNKVTL